MARKVVLSWPRPFDESPLVSAFPQAQFTKCPLGDPAIADAVADADIWIMGGPYVTAGELAAARQVRWIQLFGAGLSPAFFQPEFRDRGVLVSNASGVNVVNMAEHALAMMFAFARALPSFAAAQSGSKWVHYTEFPPLFELDGQTLGIVGYGSIGRAVGSRARALGMKVLGLRRTPTGQDTSETDAMYTPDRLAEMLGHCDHVVLCAELTGETRHMICTSTLMAMKPGSHIYNIGRGGLVDTGALIDALNRGAIAGAGLDVTDPEPLPAGHPLWSTPGVLITPHAAGITPKFFERTLDFVAANMRRFDAGQPVENAIDLNRAH